MLYDSNSYNLYKILKENKTNSDNFEYFKFFFEAKYLVIFVLFDTLQVLDQKDPNWWQAKKVGGNELPGLIPSQELEERRKAFVAPEADYVHKTSICGTRVNQ